MAARTTATRVDGRTKIGKSIAAARTRAARTQAAGIPAAMRTGLTRLHKQFDTGLQDLLTKHGQQSSAGRTTASSGRTTASRRASATT
ncbi:MAG: hypothetical protein H0X11_09990 [Betaproteobacteria bacterium]|nr:hypothetical protein [Betaproteobacteria bacterium]